MPGPGGGARGGGGGRGGSFGGGGFSSGGGRGGHFGGGFGGHHHHHHRPHRHFGFWFWPRPYYYGYGGGFFGGGFFAFLLLPIIAIIIAAVFLIVSMLNAFSALANGGVIQYDENKFQSYADSQYTALYSNTDAYLDNIVIVFLTYEDNYEYNYIAWLGEHIDNNVNYKFGGNGTELGNAMNRTVAQNYGYSLTMNLSAVIEIMESEVTELGGVDHYKNNCKDNRAQNVSKVINNTSLTVIESELAYSLESFTANTGIPISLVIEEAEDVFGKTMPGEYIVTIIISLAVIGIAIYFIVKGIRSRKNGGNGQGTNGYNGYNNNNNGQNNGSSAFHNMYGP